MNSSTASNLDQKSTPHTLPKSANLSRGQSLWRNEPTLLVVVPPAESPKQASLVAGWLPAVPTVLAGLFGIWAVHQLTKGQEREKAVFELYKSVGDHVGGAKSAAATAWAARQGPERRRAIAETKWRIQQVGGTLNRLRLLSARRRFRWALAFYSIRPISVEGAMVQFRRMLTDDPFEDPDRGPRKSRAEEIEQAAGDLLTALDAAFADWIS